MSKPQRPKQNAPAGAEKYDEGALNDFQQSKTNDKKVCLLLNFYFFFQF